MVRLRTREDVAAHVEAAVRFGTPGTVGAELEWLAVDRTAPSTRPSLDRVTAALSAAGPLPAEGRTDGKGKYLVRGFHGAYEITVNSNGIFETVNATLAKEGSEIQVALAK